MLASRHMEPSCVAEKRTQETAEIDEIQASQKALRDSIEATKDLAKRADALLHRHKSCEAPQASQ